MTLLDDVPRGDSLPHPREGNCTYQGQREGGRSPNILVKRGRRRDAVLAAEDVVGSIGELRRWKKDVPREKRMLKTSSTHQKGVLHVLLSDCYPVEGGKKKGGLRTKCAEHVSRRADVVCFILRRPVRNPGSGNRTI